MPIGPWLGMRHAALSDIKNDLPTKFIQEGIQYDDLSDDEKAEWDILDWGDSEEVPEAVDAAAINAWLFNEDTVDLVLKIVMENGLVTVVNGVFLYRVNDDGRVVSLRAFWEFDKLKVMPPVPSQ